MLLPSDFSFGRIETTYSCRVPSRAHNADLLIRVARLRAQMRELIVKAKATILRSTELQARADELSSRLASPKSTTRH
jgi:hypothetical protein